MLPKDLADTLKNIKTIGLKLSKLWCKVVEQRFINTILDIKCLSVSSEKYLTRWHWSFKRFIGRLPLEYFEEGFMIAEIISDCNASGEKGRSKEGLRQQ